MKIRSQVESNSSQERVRRSAALTRMHSDVASLIARVDEQCAADGADRAIFTKMLSWSLFLPTLTEDAPNFWQLLPRYMPLVHPSPRNRSWQKKNEWFEAELVPELRRVVNVILGLD